MHRKLVDAIIGYLGHPRLIRLIDDIRKSLAPGFNAVKTLGLPGFIAIEALTVHIHHREMVLLGIRILDWSLKYEYLGPLAEVYRQP